MMCYTVWLALKHSTTMPENVAWYLLSQIEHFFSENSQILDTIAKQFDEDYPLWSVTTCVDTEILKTCIYNCVKKTVFKIHMLCVYNLTLHLKKLIVVLYLFGELSHVPNKKGRFIPLSLRLPLLDVILFSWFSFSLCRQQIILFFHLPFGMK